ncbi:hypothetical protein FKM82_000987 [Ascaphus truei]
MLLVPSVICFLLDSPLFSSLLHQCYSSTWKRRGHRTQEQSRSWRRPATSRVREHLLEEYDLIRRT